MKILNILDNDFINWDISDNCCCNWYPYSIKYCLFW